MRPRPNREVGQTLQTPNDGARQVLQLVLPASRERLASTVQVPERSAQEVVLLRTRRAIEVLFFFAARWAEHGSLLRRSGLGRLAGDVACCEVDSIFRGQPVL